MKFNIKIYNYNPTIQKCRVGKIFIFLCSQGCIYVIKIYSKNSIIVK